MNENEKEYDQMIDVLIDGFNSVIDISNGNDKKSINAYKIEYYLHGLSEMKFMLNELELMKNHD